MKNNKGFTLIELMITITIMVIMGTVVYTPYQYMQKKQKVRNSAKIISQTLYESRNLAINGANSGTGNLAIGLSFSGGNDYINVYEYPYQEKKDFTGANYSDYVNPKYFSKKIDLVNTVNLTGGNNIIFIFNEITGSGTYYNYTSNSKITDDNIKIDIGFKNVNSGNLTKKINYYTKTYITDIE